MSAKDKAAVKASIATYIADRTEVTIKELREHVTQDTGLTFGQTTIARFIVDMGWGKKGCDAFTTIYTRNAPIDASDAGAGEVVQALVKSRDQFAFYAKEHRAKTTATRVLPLSPDEIAATLRKAETNEAMVIMCAAALATLQPDAKDGAARTAIAQSLGQEMDASSSSEFHQRRGMLADVILAALHEYDEWMIDDRYDYNVVLDNVIAQLERGRDVAALTTHEAATDHNTIGSHAGNGGTFDPSDAGAGEVVQLDRDAAAEVGSDELWCRYTRAGLNDGTNLVQAFKNHRLATQPKVAGVGYAAADAAALLFSQHVKTFDDFLQAFARFEKAVRQDCLATLQPDAKDAEIARLREALEPFAKKAAQFSKQGDGLVNVQMDFAHFRRARQELAEKP